MKQVFYSNSYKDTEKIGEDLAHTLSGGETVAFFGDLGHGKTCFVRGLARGLGYTGDVTSPTFSIVNEYRGGRLTLYHFDMYRISGWDDLYSTGFFEYGSEESVLAVEWSENILAALPDDAIKITIEQTSENCRTITVESEV